MGARTIRIAGSINYKFPQWVKISLRLCSGDTRISVVELKQFEPAISRGRGRMPSLDG